MRHKIILSLIIIEVFIIGVVAVDLYRKKNEVLGEAVSVNPINKENLAFTSVNDLTYFYEPKPNNIIIRSGVNWLPPGYSNTITINADSLNERLDYSVDKPKGTYRIVALGDSFTYGNYINTQDNWPEQLEDLLNTRLHCKNFSKFEVINLGVGGYDIEYEVARFKMRGQKYNPDLLIWFLKDDDFSLINEVIRKRVGLYEEQMKNNEELQEYRDKGIFYPADRKAAIEFKKEWGEEKILSYQKPVLNSISTYYDKKIIITTYSFLSNPHRSILKEFVQSKNNRYFYEGLPWGNPELELPDSHPNAKGHKLIAESLSKYLIENAIIPCESIP